MLSMFHRVSRRVVSVGQWVKIVQATEVVTVQVGEGGSGIHSRWCGEKREVAI